MDKRTAARIVREIVYDLRGRRGLRHQWEQIDDDIILQILRCWNDIVIKEANGK